MARYILAYDIIDYPEEGGGIEIETFAYNEKERMHERANELLSSERKIEILIAGTLEDEFKYEPVEVAIKYNPVRIP
jgi:hypothetical protein